MQSIVWDLGRVLLSLVDPDATHRPTGSTSLRSAQDDTRGRTKVQTKSPTEIFHSVGRFDFYYLTAGPIIITICILQICRRS